MDEVIANENDDDGKLSNAELWELIKILRRNCKREFLDFNDVDLDRWSELLPKFNLFLWRGGRHETHDPKIAWHAVLRARVAFYARVGVNPLMTADGGAMTRTIIWRLQTPRSWLLRTLRRAVQECQRDHEAGRLAAAPPPPEGAMRQPDPAYARLATGDCQLKRHRRAPKMIREGHCRRACDLLFMKDLTLSHREIGYVLSLPKSSVFDRLFDCEEELKKQMFRSDD